MNSEEVVLLLKKNPRIINGHAIELPKFATGTRLLLNFSGTYPVACCTACPHSCAATPSAATDVDYTLHPKVSASLFLDHNGQ